METKEWINFLEGIYQKEGVTIKTKTITRTRKEDDGIISIPLDKLFEFYANLVMNGFSTSEALEITGRIAESRVRA